MRWLALLLLLAAPASAEQVLQGTVTRVVDGDTFDVAVTIDMGTFQVVYPKMRLRLDCVNTAEKWTDDGKRLIPIVKGWIEGEEITFKVIGNGGFGRILASVTPLGWDQSLEARLFHLSDPRTPLYTGSQTTAARIAACQQRLDGER